MKNVTDVIELSRDSQRSNESCLRAMEKSRLRIDLIVFEDNSIERREL